MAIGIREKNMTEYFKSLKGTIVINDLTSKDEIKTGIYHERNNEVIDSTPECACGFIRGDIRLGTLCSKCNTFVESHIGKKYPTIWLEALRGHSGFIKPGIWVEIDSYVSKSFSILRWLSDPLYNPKATADSSMVISSFDNMEGLVRSYKWLVDNFESVLEVIKMLPKIKGKDAFHELSFIINLLKKNRELVITHMLALPNKSLLLMDKGSKGAYTHIEPLAAVKDIVYSVIELDEDTASEKRLDKLMANINYKLAGLTKEFLKGFLSGKTKVPRKHIYGTRSHFSGRAVITPIMGPHRYDDMEMPWSLAVTMLRPMLLNLLVNRENITYKKAVVLINNSIYNFNPIIDKCLKALIVESSDGISVAFQRNPTMTPSSWIPLKVRRIKTTPDDPTISLSDLITALFNADFDGDEMNVKLLEDGWMTDKMEALSAYHSMLDFNSIYKVSGLMGLGKPAISNISQMINYERGI